VKRSVAILCALALLVPASALAYVLSAWQVLANTAKHRESMELTGLILHGTFAFQGADATAAAAALKLTPASEVVSTGVVTYHMPGRCRVELDAHAGAAAPVATFVHGTVKTAGPAIPALKTFAASVCPIVAQPSLEELNAFLKSRGVDDAADTLGRLNGVVSFIIGGRPKDVGTPSFWVEKDRFDPLRLISKDGAVVEDVRLLDYSSPLCGEWHPRVVEIRRGDDLTRFVADKVETNAKVADSLFQ
jgi:hypothetical protein